MRAEGAMQLCSKRLKQGPIDAALNCLGHQITAGTQHTTDDSELLEGKEIVRCKENTPSVL